jgi:uncharacterized membrane protein
MITVPIGAFVMSLIADVVYLNTRQVFWYDMAWWTMAIGVISALAAAVPGLIDYGAVARKHPHARKTGMIHGVMNVAIVVVYGLNLYLRHHHAAVVDNTGMVVGLSVVSFLALGVSGWLGGHMAYKDRIGVAEEGDVRISMTEGARERIER